MRQRADKLRALRAEVERIQVTETSANGAVVVTADSDDIDDVAGHVADVPRADGGTGFSRAEIEQIKNHVFEDLHPLEGQNGGTVMARFDPNPDMAEAWLRLRSGRARPEDVALLEHELAEARYWQQNPNASYKDAHAAANEVSRWENQIPPVSNEDYSKPWR
ncbi:hypothetical protein [Saccharothrix deserti]|uniref:hypothetical protein n=1 Tax=Saccharothrix deserti TaxID=2593674 RepID=UPI00131C2BF2|nr:hypothetical protein [Saccharothrix deserti]